MNTIRHPLLAPLDPPTDWRRHLAPARVLVDRSLNEQMTARPVPVPPPAALDSALLHVAHLTLKMLATDPAAPWDALQQIRAALERAEDACLHIG